MGLLYLTSQGPHGFTAVKLQSSFRLSCVDNNSGDSCILRSYVERADYKILTEVWNGRYAYVLRIKHSWSMLDLRLSHEYLRGFRSSLV